MGYRGYGLPVSELISEGNIGLMQGVKKFELERSERNRFAVARHRVRTDVDDNVADHEGCRSRRDWPTHARAYSGDENFLIERLLDIVVSTRFESGNDVLRISSRGQHDNRGA